MDGQLKIGTILVSESQNKYKVNSLLGAGSQGEVYDVECGGKHYTLKWYFKHMATREQKARLDNFVTKGSPDESFLWPQDLIFNSFGEPFGYIMPLRPKNYKSIVDMMKRKAEPSFYALCRAAYNLTYGILKLHSMGYCYGVCSFNIVRFDPLNGDVLLGDIDQIVSEMDNSYIYGMPPFMAPEIVMGKAKPSRNTALYSLAVLLFYIFMMGHPLEGKLEADNKCMDMHAMNKLYGSHPVFIYDPTDKSNRPVPGYQDNVIIYWDMYPQIIRDLFMESFTVGLTSPNERVIEKEWLDAFSNLMSCIVPCPKCGAEVFYDEFKVNHNVAHTCWNCQNAVPVPASLVIEKHRVLLQKDAKLYSHHIYSDYDMNTVVGEVVQNPKNPSIWGIRNDSKVNWIYIKPDGMQIPIAIGKSAAIAKDVKINFGQVTGEIEESRNTLKRSDGEFGCGPLHLFWIVDCSNSMYGEKIGSVNHAIQSTIPDMKDAALNNPNAQLLVRTLKFSTSASWVTSNPVSIEDFAWDDLDAGGDTDFGEALNLLIEQLSQLQMNDRVLHSTMVLILGSKPTDSWKNKLDELLKLPAGKNSMRIAIAVGHDADQETLSAFAETEGLILQANNLGKITELMFHHLLRQN